MPSPDVTPRPLPPRARVQRQVMRTVFRLPTALKRRLAGAPISIDGQTLALDAQLMAVLGRRTGTRMVVDASPAASRKAMEDGAPLLRGAPIPSVRSRDITIPTGEQPLRARLYQPGGRSGPGPLLVWFHGGGWVIGSIDSYDAVLRFLAHHSGTAILSVDYRLAPEHPHPAAWHDALAAFAWAREHAGELDADPSRIAVGGDSAGAHLSAVLCQTLAERGGPGPVHQVLFYPAADLTTRHPSRSLFAEGFVLTDAEIEWFKEQYAPGADHSDPALSPLLAEVHPDTAPATVTTAGFDPLRDEGEAFAGHLKAARVPVTLHREADLVHGYLNFYALSRRFDTAAKAAAARIREALHPALERS
ncbi:alpha/beta hydrolase [Streptomyces sp. NPDC020192]|uniref:alpha/beta hydrolase n=1 Tax=Streptomyces sp. NPDC020192 TaxID=3365066 RepID=UPI0037BB4875